LCLFVSNSGAGCAFFFFLNIYAFVFYFFILKKKEKNFTAYCGLCVVSRSFLYFRFLFLRPALLASSSAREAGAFVRAGVYKFRAPFFLLLSPGDLSGCG
jgi:hypothetical protein